VEALVGARTREVPDVHQVTLDVIATGFPAAVSTVETRLKIGNWDFPRLKV